MLRAIKAVGDERWFDALKARVSQTAGGVKASIKNIDPRIAALGAAAALAAQLPYGGYAAAEAAYTGNTDHARRAARRSVAAAALGATAAVFGPAGPVLAAVGSAAMAPDGGSPALKEASTAGGLAGLAVGSGLLDNQRKLYTLGGAFSAGFAAYERDHNIKQEPKGAKGATGTKGTEGPRHSRSKRRADGASASGKGPTGVMTPEEAYGVLDADREAAPNTDRHAKRRYHMLAKRWHPDRNPGTEEAAAEEFKRIRAAYEVAEESMKFGRASRSHRKRPKATRAQTAAKQRTKRARGRADS